jgi:hypothetical protein
MEAVHFFQTLLNFSKTTKHHIQRIGLSSFPKLICTSTITILHAKLDNRMLKKEIRCCISLDYTYTSPMAEKWSISKTESHYEQQYRGVIHLTDKEDI